MQLRLTHSQSLWKQSQLQLQDNPKLTFSRKGLSKLAKLQAQLEKVRLLAFQVISTAYSSVNFDLWKNVGHVEKRGECLATSVIFMNFADADTVEKAHYILDSDISLREDSRRALAAYVEDATVDIDLEKHLITHHCAVWSRSSLEKRFYPHVARLFLSIKPEKARHVLGLINSDLDSWRFNSKLAVEFPT
jgi:hypothetical protein